MLYLTRKLNESIIINDSVEMTVIEIKGKSVKLGFTFGEKDKVLRKEIHERVLKEEWKEDD
ncbi:hypothetical protein LCGC14_2659890 [marine sediment metagenome]|uniref:Carbon storage regulator n=1 Tax=marine sediment metagenome TaxID=412755 RepID=A0A0F8ZSC8_9ZZZZ